jgi:toxin-antitoxin system PIN domain toxin
MRFLVDTNILLHAANSASPFHRAARAFLDRQLRDRVSWCTTWPILYEFLRVSTHHRVFPKPLKAQQSLAFIEALINREEVVLLSATDRHRSTLASVIDEVGHPSGNLFHDIHTATLMREHGVSEIITADTDFLQFHFLRVTNPVHQ